MCDMRGPSLILRLYSLHCVPCRVAAAWVLKVMRLWTWRHWWSISLDIKRWHYHGQGLHRWVPAIVHATLPRSHTTITIVTLLWLWLSHNVSSWPPNMSRWYLSKTQSACFFVGGKIIADRLVMKLSLSNDLKPYYRKNIRIKENLLIIPFLHYSVELWM